MGAGMSAWSNRARPPFAAAVKYAIVGALFALGAIIFLVATAMLEVVAAQVVQPPMSFAILASSLVAAGIVATGRLTGSQARRRDVEQVSRSLAAGREP